MESEHVVLPPFRILIATALHKELHASRHNVVLVNGSVPPNTCGRVHRRSGARGNMTCTNDVDALSTLGSRLAHHLVNITWVGGLGSLRRIGGDHGSARNRCRRGLSIHEVDRVREASGSS